MKLHYRENCLSQPLWTANNRQDKEILLRPGQFRLTVGGARTAGVFLFAELPKVDLIGHE
jgi:hypothetical protein